MATTKQWLEFFCVKDTRDIGSTYEYELICAPLNLSSLETSYFFSEGLLNILGKGGRYGLDLRDGEALCVVSTMVHKGGLEC